MRKLFQRLSSRKGSRLGEQAVDALSGVRDIPGLQMAHRRRASVRVVDPTGDRIGQRFGSGVILADEGGGLHLDELFCIMKLMVACGGR